MCLWFPLSFSLPAGWNINIKVGVQAAVLGHEVNPKMEARAQNDRKMIKEFGSLMAL